MTNLTEGELLEQNDIVLLIFGSSSIFQLLAKCVAFGKEWQKY